MANRALFRRCASVFALAVVAAGTLLGTPAWAGETAALASLPDGVRVVELDGTTLYASARELTSDELEGLAALQNDEQITTTISFASSDQRVQLLEDLSRPMGSYSAAVLVDEPDQNAEPFAPRSLCAPNSSASAVSHHNVAGKHATYGYCDLGPNNVSRGGFYKIENKWAYTLIYASTTTGTRTCPPYATCSLTSAYLPATLTNVVL